MTMNKKEKYRLKKQMNKMKQKIIDEINSREFVRLCEDGEDCDCISYSETIEAMKAARRGELTEVDNVDDLFDSLNNDKKLIVTDLFDKNLI